jgi:hypothetical protein
MGSAEGALRTAATRIGLTVHEYRAHIEADKKWCGGCKDWHLCADFGADRSRGDGFAKWCRTFANERGRFSYIPRKPVRRKSCYPTEGDAARARYRVNHLVATGRLPHPNTLPCADCGHACAPGGRRHEYDHHKGYSVEHHLDVEAVCTLCHNRRGRERGTHIRKHGPDGRFVG